MEIIEVLKAVLFIVGFICVCFGWCAFLYWLDPNANWYGCEDDDFLQ